MGRRPKATFFFCAAASFIALSFAGGTTLNRVRRRSWVLAVAFSLAFNAAESSEIPSQQARVEQAEDARFQGAIGSISVFGIPEMTNKANRKWRDLFANALLDRGETKTGRKGHVMLRLADGGKLRLGPSSSLILDRLLFEGETGATELELRSGEIDCQPAEPPRSKSALIVRSPVMVVKAERAWFSIRYSADGQLTTVSALRGSVHVERRDGSAALTLSEGQQIAVKKTASGLPVPGPID